MSNLVDYQARRSLVLLAQTVAIGAKPLVFLLLQLHATVAM